MKDKHAVTTQQISFPFPRERDVEQALGAVAIDGLEVLRACRHPHKLRTGHLRANRFDLRLRQIAPTALQAARIELEAIGERGVPNAFGPQRFGRGGDNAERALAWLSGTQKRPRDRKQQRLMFSALQSWLFNKALDERQRDGTWNRVVSGDLALKHDSGGMFIVPRDGPELAEAESRAERCQLSATGPMFGAKMRRPEGRAAELEAAVLDSAGVALELFERNKKLGAGTRRSLRLVVSELDVQHQPSDGSLRVSFVLPKGGYATTVLSRVFRLIDPHAAP
jgi:tRNA pseudouridine13 synthase